SLHSLRAGLASSAKVDAPHIQKHRVFRPRDHSHIGGSGPHSGGENTWAAVWLGGTFGSTGSKRLCWSGGDDMVRVDTLHYTMKEPSRWIGREPPLYRINRAITLLAGLYGAHMAEFLLSRGVPEPKDDRAHTRLRPDDE
ncbi:MAG: hypothetical protein K9G72_21200, partial [Rhodobacteraceae bacterium]|nr:hypothetical protein [Paracoccaceae bacterium]